MEFFYMLTLKQIWGAAIGKEITIFPLSVRTLQNRSPNITKPPPAVFVYLQIKKQKANNAMYILLIKNLRCRFI